jgi:hypothetical protein
MTQRLKISFGVMRGLDPRIHPFCKMADCRVSPLRGARQ